MQEADVDAGLLDRLRTHRPDCIVPLLHGAAGEDGALRDLLECLQIPFVGSGAAASRLAFDKPITKELVTQAGLRTPECVAMPQSTFRELGAAAVLDAVVERLGLPLVVKPTRGGSSLGTAIVHSAVDLPSAMVGAFAYGDVVLMEQYIAGTELAIGVFERDDDLLALSAVEIVPEGELYDYAARYTAGTTEFFCPARLDDETGRTGSGGGAERPSAAGPARPRRAPTSSSTPTAVPWFLEVNVAPGMTETSLFPQALAAADVGLGTVIAELVETAVDARWPRADRQSRAMQVDDPTQVLEVRALDHEASA